MISYFHGMVSEAVWPFVFLVVFLIIGGGALYLTPRIAEWIDEKRRSRPGYYDGMLEQSPDAAEMEPGEE